MNTHRHLHVVCIEDPIEYIHSNRNSVVNQREESGRMHGPSAKPCAACFASRPT